MGSGLILLVIVGAWLAVLVPMALKSHDTTSSLHSTDRFGDAMRVLSRGGAGDRRSLLVRRHSAYLVSPKPETAADPLAPLTVAERRRRTLLVLLAAAAGTLVGGLFLPVVLAPHLFVDVLLVAFVVHLRRQARFNARLRLEVRARRTASLPARRVPRIAGIPDRMPSRPAPPVVPAPRYEDVPLPAAGPGLGAAWSPVPVPPPSYVGKAIVAQRTPWSQDVAEALADDDTGLDRCEEGPELEEILDRRRAAIGW